MPDHRFSPAAHESFPLSAPALQSASLRPDFRYFEVEYARQLSAHLELPAPSFSPSELAAIGLLGKVFLVLIGEFLGASPESFPSLSSFLQRRLGAQPADQAILETVSQFPTVESFKDPDHKRIYSLGSQGSVEARLSFLQSLILILVAEHNPAIRASDGLFTSPVLRSSTPVQNLLSSLQSFLSGSPAHGSGAGSVMDLLLEPARLHPTSLYDQLLYVRSRWENLLDDHLLQALLICLDQFKEEKSKPAAAGVKTPGDPLGYLTDPDAANADLAKFSYDHDWMPQAVLQAKNVSVWLDQLSREYQQPISRLDQIPEDELRKLSRRGMNALWLIGLWERSPASQKIKRLCGNPEAESSAYSLFDYTIAENLGGDAAYQHLAAAASRYNIRLAADMVPNHMGVDSRWVADHPDWFLSLDHPPFPGYTYQGTDLSSNPSVSLYLEDHYYDRSDAAVVFKRKDTLTGDTRYLYHGNDGTSMPWNDTAQLDFLNPAVREAVIQTILHVARKFPIIRFDAAMTLTKKHYQRLWFPRPGTGGAIPTRSSFGLSKKQFDASMPKEFWGEVVDRVAEEVPGTLLLAEAFWMMEGYFVRSLGMHRVYNSAFMHMLRDEDNQKYRELVAKTLEFDPQILKRYVNFMNNPDEETALAQFGSGGKYFGTCLMMCTLPGLPMFGHGQVEGFSEKYGMEYKRAYYDESPDQALIERHQKEIFPLLHKRYLFSEVDRFVLYDLVKGDGTVDENVFVYSNCAGDERALIVFHNKWGDTRGWVSRSTPLCGHSADLLTGLGIPVKQADYLIFEDLISGQEFIRSIDDLSSAGLYLDLGAYDYRALANFKVVSDPDGSYAALARSLNGAGIFNLPQRLLELRYAPLAKPIAALLSRWKAELPPPEAADWAEAPDLKNRALQIAAPSSQEFYGILSAIFPDLKIDISAVQKAYLDRISCITCLLSHRQGAPFPPDLPLLLPWAFLASLTGVPDQESILSALASSLAPITEGASDTPATLLLRKLSLQFYLTPRLADLPLEPSQLADFWFTDPHTSQFIQLHEHQGEAWFHKESMETLINLSFDLFYLLSCFGNPPDFTAPAEEEDELQALLDLAIGSLERSDYKADRFMKIMSQQGLRK